MNDIAESTSAGRRSPFLSACWGERHFLVAVGLLVAVTVGWNWAIAQLRWATRKEAVPWPPLVRVDAHCRVTSFPQRLGPYVLVGDGEIDKVTDGRPDGQVVLEEDVLESLKIDTPLDQKRLGERRSNWYLTHLYRNTHAESPANPYRYWRLEVYYYTGGLDKVPHVPDRCLVAGGATLLPSAASQLTVMTPVSVGHWEKVTFNRVGYEVTDRIGLNVKQHVQYYLFSLNGRPEGSWEKVRLGLTKPWVRHCYFAKVQLAPLGSIEDFNEADQATKDFLNLFLPEVVAMFPTPSDIGKLDSLSP